MCPLPPPRVAVAALAALVLLPTAAHADSLVFVKDDDVWLAQPDGGKLTRVTTDGTADAPYRSPSQADDGTIAVSHLTYVERLRQNGELLSRIDPPPLVDSTSHPVDGTPVSVAISPDGSKVAYSYAGYSCPIGTECAARSVTGITDADRFTPASTYATATYGSPKWVGNGRLQLNGGFLSHVNLLDIAPGSTAVHWFDDQDYFSPSSDLGQAEISADGRRVVAIHGYDSTTPSETSDPRLVWFATADDVRSGPLPPSRPDRTCFSSAVTALRSPTWSPSGADLAFVLPDGVHVARDVPTDSARCEAFSEALVVAGASEPDWGPADVAPTPRNGVPSPPGGGGTPGTPGKPAGPSGSGGGTPKATLTVVGKPRLRGALRSGFRVRVAGAAARSRLTVAVRLDRRAAKRLKLGRSATTVASGHGRAGADGRATVRVRFTRKAAKRLRGQRRLVATLRASGATSRRLTLR